MIVNDNYGYEVRKTDPHRHKYADAMAEYLDLHMDDVENHSGDVECPTGYFARFGRRLLITDSRGFVWVEKYQDVRGAERMYEALERYYGIWADEEMEESAPDIRQTLLALADRYLQYVAQNEVNNLESHPYIMWRQIGEPDGYLHSANDPIGRYPLVQGITAPNHPSAHVPSAHNNHNHNTEATS